jgi:hypothetical protein
MSTFFVTDYQDTKQDGGRDGLGLLPIWSKVARRCIWNVTSISGDLAGWRSLVACVYLAERIPLKTADKREDLLLAIERLIGIARCHAPDGQLRSRDGVRGQTRLLSLPPSATLSGIKILRNQKATGIIGQIGRPAIRSGLLTEELRLSDSARQDVERWLAPLIPHLSELKQYAYADKVIDLANLPECLNVLAQLTGPNPLSGPEARWWFNRLLCASGATDPDGVWSTERQTELAKASHRLPSTATDTANLPQLLRKSLPDSASANQVRDWLLDIESLEALLGRMESAFTWLRGATHEPVDITKLAEQLKAQWAEQQKNGKPGWCELRLADQQRALHLLAHLPEVEQATFRAFAVAVVSGDALACIQTLLQRNATVVHHRNRQRWISGEKFLRAEITSNPKRLADGDRWVHSYYLKELHGLERACRVAPAEEGS